MPFTSNNVPRAVSILNGNWDTASIWARAYADSEATKFICRPDTFAALTDRSTINGTVVRCNNASNPVGSASGLLGFVLYCKQGSNPTGTVTVREVRQGGTRASVTINAADLPVNFDWVFFKTTTTSQSSSSPFELQIAATVADNMVFKEEGALTSSGVGGMIIGPALSTLTSIIDFLVAGTQTGQGLSTPIQVNILGSSQNYITGFQGGTQFGPVYPPLANVWNGSVNNRWENTGNWSKGYVPLSTELVIVPNTSGGTIYVPTPGTTIYDLNTDTGTAIEVENGTFTISGAGLLNSSYGYDGGVASLRGSITAQEIRIEGNNSGRVHLAGTVVGTNKPAEFVGVALSCANASADFAIRLTSKHVSLVTPISASDVSIWVDGAGLLTGSGIMSATTCVVSSNVSIESNAVHMGRINAGTITLHGNIRMNSWNSSNQGKTVNWNGTNRLNLGGVFYDLGTLNLSNGSIVQAVDGAYLRGTTKNESGTVQLLRYPELTVDSDIWRVLGDAGGNGTFQSATVARYVAKQAGLSTTLGSWYLSTFGAGKFEPSLLNQPFQTANTSTTVRNGGSWGSSSDAAAGTVQGIVLYCKRGSNPTGTVTLRMNYFGSTRDSVTVNATDLPVNYNWVFFKMATTGGGSGSVAEWTIQSSVNDNMSFKALSNIAAGMIVLNTSPGSLVTAADRLVVGSLTAAGASTSVLIDNTSDSLTSNFVVGYLGSVPVVIDNAIIRKTGGFFGE